MEIKKGKTLSRVVGASLIGSTIEWYDFFLYGVVAGIVFNKLYFPADDPIVSTLLAYATFAVGFIARPVGGLIFGHFGDKIGRKSMLITSLGIMGGSTVLIALIPTYNQIGIWAPICLLILRILQGIGLGGEWGGAVLMTFEHAPLKKRGLYASLPQIGLSIGLLLSSGVVGVLSSTLSDSQFMSWGWRIAFALSSILIFLGLWIRLNISESPEFKKVKESNIESNMPIKDMWKNNTGNVLAGMGARYIDGVFFNVMGVFSITYLTNSLDLSRTEALLGVSAAAFVMCFFIPIFGHISDRFGRTRTYLIGSLVTGLSALPAFLIMSNSNGSTLVIWLALIIPLGIFYSSVYGPEAALFAELFEAPVRYTGMSFVYQFSGIFASGFTPIIATALLGYNNGSPFLLSLYVVFAGLVSAISVWWIGNNKKLKSTPNIKSEAMIKKG
ncbi:MHS family MFS transporter [Bacillus sp. ISL-4]|uniref:MFS transporter n=1 Tax=Bacillus sp. ISL-4 TaxID=2819125 RepID=UPI001BE81F13|nr:MFS transporter [Bacillus sp. ISL-4]MBT2666868.1 MHS family MFS transporter [Bacillus sp. ISL-4]MBT2673535.1 MHS family MFS transporter [Streptomyces sp. ISL-14]